MFLCSQRDVKWINFNLKKQVKNTHAHKHTIVLFDFYFLAWAPFGVVMKWEWMSEFLLPLNLCVYIHIYKTLILRYDVNTSASTYVLYTVCIQTWEVMWNFLNIIELCYFLLVSTTEGMSSVHELFIYIVVLSSLSIHKCICWVSNPLEI